MAAARPATGQGGADDGPADVEKQPLLTGGAAGGPQLDAAQKTSTRRYQDVWFAVAFLLHVGVACWLVADYSSDVWQQASAAGGGGGNSSSILGNVLFQLAVITSLTSVALSFAWLMVMKKHAKTLVWFSLWFAFCLLLAFALSMMAVGQYIAGALALLLCLLYLFFIFNVQAYIPFAAANLEVACHLVNTFPSTVLLTYAGLIPMLGWLVLVVVTIFVVQQDQADGWQVVVAYLVFSLYWTVQVFHNIIYVSCAGVFANWYMMSGRGDSLRKNNNVCCSSLGRACTTSFGSICMGALLVAFVQALRTLTDSRRRNNAWTCLMDCLLQCIEDVIKYLNKYAFVYVALFGDSYYESGRRVFQLFGARGIAAIINDDLISVLLAFSSLVVACLNGLVGAALGFLFAPDQWVFGAVIAFALGLLLGVFVMQTLECAVTTVFVCWAKDPHVLGLCDAALYNKMMQAWIERAKTCGDAPQWDRVL